MISAKDYADALHTVEKEWGEEVVRMACLANKKPMGFDEFLNECTACGGNWGGMLLTGIDKLWPDVWCAIPDYMGIHAFTTICNLLILLGVDTSGEG